jgi:general secretion pathway protein C
MIMRRMVLSAPSLWWPRLAAFVLAALAAASAAVWGLRVAAPVQASSIATVAAPAVPPDTVAVVRALGGSAVFGEATAVAQAAPVLESARFALVGVVAQPNTKGAALVSVDGKPAKPYVVGATMVDGWTLQSVQGRRATLARNGAEMVLELPPANTAPVVKAPMAAPAMSTAAAASPSMAMKGKTAP